MASVKEVPQLRKRRVDLHMHSNCSDGVYSPKDLVRKAKDSGLVAIALTDHDEVRGVTEAVEAGKAHGVEVVPGIEISCLGDGLDVHMLGLFIEPEHPGLREYVRWYHDERLARGRKIVERLRELGYPLDFDELAARVGEAALGRPHIAEALVQEGYVASVQEAFDRLLGDGKPAFVPKRKLTPAEAISLIHAAGGLAVLAHPGDGLTVEQVEQAVRLGIDGLEVVHPRHSEEVAERIRQIARKHGLLETGGSDFHGRGDEQLLGTLNVFWESFEELRLAHLRTRRSTLEVAT